MFKSDRFVERCSAVFGVSAEKSVEGAGVCAPALKPEKTTELRLHILPCLTGPKCPAHYVWLVTD